ncbi:MAG: hypothetical protein ABI678_07865, partial [Kofleriaceae bacterium]
REHGARWTAELGIEPRKRAVPGQVPQVLFRRGFPEEVELDVRELARVDLSQVPVRSLVVDGVSDANVVELVARAAIPTLRSFGLRRAHLKPRSLRRLGEAALVTGAAQLVFHHGGMNDAAELAALALPALRSLRLDDPHIRNLEVFARARWLPQLRELSIRDTHGLGVWRLLRAKELTSLTKLVLEANLADPTLAALASSETLRELEHLELVIGYLDRGAVAAFHRTTGFAKLKRLVVRGTLLDEARATLRERWGDKLSFV